jgi:hypothetical protein
MSGAPPAATPPASESFSEPGCVDRLCNSGVYQNILHARQ